MGSTQKAVRRRLWEFAGSSPPIAAVSRFFLGKRGGGLETPPGTDAVQHGFHLLEIVEWFFLTLH